MTRSLAVSPLDLSADEVVECLVGGGVVLMPTDTVYGLAAIPSAPDAVRRIFALKGRPPSVNLPILIADPGQIADLGGIARPAAVRLLQSSFVPGAVTLAVGIDGATAAPWLVGRDEAAFRIPADGWLLSVLRRTRAPIGHQCQHACPSAKGIGYRDTGGVGRCA